MHLWGDEDFDWESLDKAISLMTLFMRRWGRIGVNSKEKYGTARIYVTFFDGTLHSFIYPGYIWTRFPKWLWQLDLNYISRFNAFLGITKFLNWWQRKVYALAYKKALKKFPHIKAEIVIAADYDELIEEYESIVMKYNMVKRIQQILFYDQDERDLIL